MTKAILCIALGLTTLFSENTLSSTMTEKNVKIHSDTKFVQKKYRTDKKHFKNMDRQLSKKRAMKRKFKTHDEFKKMKHHRANKRLTKHSIENRSHKRSQRHSNYKQDRYTEGRRYYRDNDRRYSRDHHSKTHGHRHTRNSWYLTYRYERTSFYDRYGYYYGYFNRHGYLFEGDFYRYDRYYTYRDRVRGKGLFDYRYYRPVMDYYSSSFDDPYYRR